MIGTETVSLNVVPDYDQEFARIWGLIKKSTDYDLWFGPRTYGKEPRGSSIRPELAVLFAGVAVGMFVDAQGDVESAWNTWNLTWFIVLLAILAAGVIFSLTPKKIDSVDWKLHRYVVSLGGRVNIGVCEIWQDTDNATCKLIVAMLAEYRGQKLGSVAARLMLRKSFQELGARRVESSALATNPYSLRMNDGLIEEGILRGRWIVRGKPCDEYLYRLTKEEWLAQIEKGQPVPQLPSGPWGATKA
jgi:hypothetical protein